MRFILGIALVFVASCTSMNAGRLDEMTTHPDAPPIAPFTECSVYTAREPSYGNDHVPVCSELTLPAFPPTSGTHFRSWADFGTYDAPVPWGYLMHSMEHGTVVIGYRCEGDCSALTAELQAVIDAQPIDPLCRGDDPARFILAPMPDLEWPIAVLAWENLYLATCFDRPSMEAFITRVYAQAPENLCAPGIDDAAMGWCP